MAIKKPDNYWDNKFLAYMHDPFDKAFGIKGHENRSNELLELYTGLGEPNEEFWKKADGIASGLERGQIVSYKKDEAQSGAVNFMEKPVLSHPTGEKAQININFAKDINADKVWKDLKEFIKKEIGAKPSNDGYSNKFAGKPDEFAKARFFYTHLVLRFRLAQENIGGIGALWHRLPADTRFPDHSIWQHNALVSAIQSCFDIGGVDDLGMMVLSITPVQSFISKARKLRDLWTGSVLLSWLTFEGIKWVMENLGPDHIIYPSLIDQFLVNKYLEKSWKINSSFSLNERSDIASFPNKILFLIPKSKAEEIAKEVEKAILKGWKTLYTSSSKEICKKLGLDKDKASHMESMFKRQNENYWDIQWVAVDMLKEENKDEIGKLLSSKNYENQFDILDHFKKMTEGKGYKESGIGILYSVSHSLCQSALASQKTSIVIKNRNEPGEKCLQCGEFEVLHDVKYNNDASAREYNSSIKDFWKKFKEEWDGDNGNDFNKNEKLCSICLTKRIAYHFLKKDQNHILNSTFKDADSFPSTTYLALYDLFERNHITDKQIKNEIVNYIHNEPETLNPKKNYNYSNKKIYKIESKDRYYAILMMDGDKMGQLVNGETIASTWSSIIHPDIYTKLLEGTIEKQYSGQWQHIFNSETLKKRNITPAIHAAISESLGDFAVYGVAYIVNKYGGRLIYAGGDDVCAVLPMDNVIEAAEEISKYYTSSFKMITKSAEPKDITNNFTPQEGKLSVNLGKGKEISISAGIIICHHKDNLSHLIKESHELLNGKAKKESGRNAIAIQLKKRSGGDRFFVSKWNDERFQAFKELKMLIGDEMSRSLAYRLAMFRDGVDAILKSADKDDLLYKFILKQLERSGTKSESEEILAKNIAKVVIDSEGFNNEPLLIAGFLNKKGATDE